MVLTNEQINIINSNDNMVVVAGAGAAKTTTLIEYAKLRPKGKILYLAFNKSIKDEAILKFKKNGINNIKIETAHSLAYKNFNNIKVTSGYSLSDIIDICKIKSEDKSEQFLLAKLIQDAINIYCNKASNTFEPKDMFFYYDSKIIDEYFELILKGLKVMLTKMKKGVIPFVHDYYLKLFQINKPILPYTHILFDEGQDASPVMLDIFLNQKQAKKVIVGDSAQSIYGYRLAVNALDMVNFKKFTLSKSFRFNNTIAQIANNILSWKKLIGTDNNTIKLQGIGGSNEKKTICFIARSNFGLLNCCISQVESLKPRKIYFEGGAKGYSFLYFNQNIYDLINLYNYNRAQIKNPLIKSLKNLNEAIEYFNKINDIELVNLAKIVQKYGNKLKKHINYIKDIITENKEDADIIFSTTHKSKGLEYDTVYLTDDFITLNEVKIFSEYLKNAKRDIFVQKEIRRINEEINILYVAATRTKNELKKSYL